ncbi:hypothetical protein E2C01_055221 [Portunus trituberculatus]|uniref:Uncharacterized protein n=1 Tax=Portunus trituberculatus TaxID=210409 RepID=A0A5B7GW88_PORTR|nr:hypothetical protein [Portunus trituberculatus]
MITATTTTCTTSTQENTPTSTGTGMYRTPPPSPPSRPSQNLVTCPRGDQCSDRSQLASRVSVAAPGKTKAAVQLSTGAHGTCPELQGGKMKTLPTTAPNNLHCRLHTATTSPRLTKLLFFLPSFPLFSLLSLSFSLSAPPPSLLPSLPPDRRRSQVHSSVSLSPEQVAARLCRLRSHEGWVTPCQDLVHSELNSA